MSSDFQNLFGTHELVLDSYSYMKVVLKLASPFLLPPLISVDTFKGKFACIHNQRKSTLFLTAIFVFIDTHRQVQEKLQVLHIKTQRNKNVKYFPPLLVLSSCTKKNY